MASSETIDRIRSFWDADAASYDLIPGHYPQTPAQWAAWRGALEPLLPPAPSSVLDVGAGMTARRGAFIPAFVPAFVQPKAPPANALRSRGMGADALQGHASALNTGCRAIHNRTTYTDNAVCPLPL
jgi:hypothetical protein